MKLFSVVLEYDLLIFRCMKCVKASEFHWSLFWLPITVCSYPKGGNLKTKLN